MQRLVPDFHTVGIRPFERDLVTSQMPTLVSREVVHSIDRAAPAGMLVLPLVDPGSTSRGHSELGDAVSLPLRSNETAPRQRSWLERFVQREAASEGPLRADGVTSDEIGAGSRNESAPNLSVQSVASAARAASQPWLLPVTAPVQPAPPAAPLTPLPVRTLPGPSLPGPSLASRPPAGTIDRLDPVSRSEATGSAPIAQSASPTPLIQRATRTESASALSPDEQSAPPTLTPPDPTPPDPTPPDSMRPTLVSREALSTGDQPSSGTAAAGAEPRAVSAPPMSGAPTLSDTKAYGAHPVGSEPMRPHLSAVDSAPPSYPVGPSRRRLGLGAPVAARPENAVVLGRSVADHSGGPISSVQHRPDDSTSARVVVAHPATAKQHQPGATTPTTSEPDASITTTGEPDASITTTGEPGASITATGIASIGSMAGPTIDPPGGPRVAREAPPVQRRTLGQRAAHPDNVAPNPETKVDRSDRADAQPPAVTTAPASTATNARPNQPGLAGMAGRDQPTIARSGDAHTVVQPLILPPAERSWREPQPVETARSIGPTSTTQPETTQHEASQHETSQHEASQHETTQPETSQHETSQHETSQHETMVFGATAETLATNSLASAFRPDIVENLPSRHVQSRVGTLVQSTRGSSARSVERALPAGSPVQRAAQRHDDRVRHGAQWATGPELSLQRVGPTAGGVFAAIERQGGATWSAPSQHTYDLLRDTGQHSGTGQQHSGTGQQHSGNASGDSDGDARKLGAHPPSPQDRRERERLVAEIAARLAEPDDRAIDRTARRLYPRLRALLAADLRLDRERSGRTQDGRW